MPLSEQGLMKLLEEIAQERDALAIQVTALVAIVGAGLKKRPVPRVDILEWAREIAGRSSTIEVDDIMGEADAIMAGPRRAN